MDNIEQMWSDLGSPTFGLMGFELDWVTVPGATLPITVRWRGTEVDVTSQTNLQQLKLFRSNGSSTTINTTVKSGTFLYSGNLIYKCSVKTGGQWETIDFFNNSHIRRGLGLNGVPYPSSGSWDDYIEYARSQSSSMPWYDLNVGTAGYRRKFGVLTLINFWNKNKPMHSETPELWRADAQPITAVKYAVDLFVDFVESVDADDRVGLVVYNGADGEATTELGLTHDFDLAASTMRQRQAGHYHHYTNIGAGLRNGREELEATGRAVYTEDGCADDGRTGELDERRVRRDRRQKSGLGRGRTLPIR